MSNPINPLFEAITPTEEQKARMYREIMKRSKTYREKDSSHSRKWGRRARYLVASMLVVWVTLYALSFFDHEDTAFALYAYETNTELTSSGVELSTGMIDDDGSMKGNLLQFYVKGKNIKRIRFSVKNQYMDFTDWTEKRPSHSMEKQFSVTYGEHTSDYYYLVVDWKPELTIRELTDHSDRMISSLSEQLRNDMIVMEVTYIDGTTATKALYITIQNNGKVLVKFQDYVVTDKDDFVLKPSEKLTPLKKSEEEYEPQSYADVKYSEAEIKAAEKVVREYYSRFPKNREIVKISSKESVEQFSSFIPDEYKNWQIIAFEAYEKSMYPDDVARHILLAREDATKEWIVINEGY